jgi:hypothetical protein
MPETDAARVMHVFLDALAERDFVRARSCLSDCEFNYISPLSAFSDADAFITDFSRLGAILERLETRHIFVDGPEICAIITITVRMSVLRTIPLALWVTTAGGRIARMQAFYDGREYDALFEV